MGVYLYRDGPASSAPSAGSVRVCDSRVDVRTVSRIAAASLRRSGACEADVDDVVQTLLIRAWLSGRGLPEDPGLAAQALAWRARREVLCERWVRRRQRYMHLGSRADDVEAEWGSTAQVEHAVDAQTVGHLAVSTDAGQRRGGRNPAARAAVALDVLRGELSASDAAREHGATQQAWSQAARTLAQRLRVAMSD